MGFFFIKDLMDSIEMDQNAYGNYQKAYKKQAEAGSLLSTHKLKADNALMKVANRKKGILSTSIADFIKVYERMIKIKFEQSDEISLIFNSDFSPQKLSELKIVSSKAMQPISDKEFLLELVKGLCIPFYNSMGGMMIADSERELNISKGHLKAAEVTLAQANTYATSLDAITRICEKTAALLTKLNVLFVKSIRYTDELIKERGFNGVNYNTDDRKALMTCMNIASTIKIIIYAPMLDKNNMVTQAIQNAIAVGNEYINKLENI